MATLTADTPRQYELGDRNEFAMIAADIIYEGAAVGIVTASGHARPLTSADRFAGFAEKKADNSAGAAAAINVRVRKKGVIQLSVSGAVITDVGHPVYATDDNTFVFTKASGVFVGKVRKFVSSGVVTVEFDADNMVDPHEGLAAETISDNKTLDAEDTGKLFQVDTDAKTITLLAVEGIKCRIANVGAYGAVLVTVSPNANDLVKAPDITAADNKDLLNTKATANRGDYIDIEYADATGWMVTAMKGTWAREA